MIGCVNMEKDSIADLNLSLSTYGDDQKADIEPVANLCTVKWELSGDLEVLA